MQCLAPALLLIGSSWVPRSPRWLVSKGKLEEAKAVLKRLRQSPDDPNDLVAEEEFFQISEQLKLDGQKLKATGYRSVWAAVWRKKSYRKRMLMGFLIQWGAEFGGPLIINNVRTLMGITLALCETLTNPFTLRFQYAVILYTNLGQTGGMPLLLSALWLTTAGLIYNPGGAWLQDKVNSRRTMFITGLCGCLITTACLCAMIAKYAGTSNRVGNGFGIFFIFLYLAFQGTGCDTTMYLWVSEIFPTEMRSIGMGFSLSGHFAATIIVLQTAPTGFAEVGWKYFLLVVCWCAVFIPSKSYHTPYLTLVPTDLAVVYFYFPEIARLSLEEVAAKFGDEVAVHITDASQDDRDKLERAIEHGDDVRRVEVTHVGLVEKAV